MSSTIVAAAEAEARLRKRVERERRARQEAERISEHATRSLFERQQELALLGAIASAANEADNLSEVIGLTLDRVCAHIGFPLGHAFLRTDRDQMTPTGIWHDDDPDRHESFRRVTEESRFDRGEGLTGRVLESAEPAWIVDVTGDPNFPRREAAQEAGIRAAMAFPILVGSRCEGALEFFHGVSTQPQQALMGLMHQIGTQLGRLVERIRAQERVAHQATHDPLTELPNRVLFKDRLDQALQRGRRNDSAIAVCFIDLDRFKSLNDSFGHEAGDELLRLTAKRLRSRLRPADTVARIGGDEFVVLFEDLGDDGEALRLVERLHQTLCKPVTLGGRRHGLGASIGVAISSGGPSADALMRDADAAMYRAKERGGGRFELCDEAMRDRAMRRASVEEGLDHALEADELELHFQPIVALGDGRIAAVEALIRWVHPERGMVSPGEFIPIAEETGQILAIGEWVLRTACRQAATWRRDLGTEALAPIAVNLSARQLASPDLGDQVEAILAETGCDPADLALELTESAAVANGDLAFETLERLRARGVSVLLDDFGTGYSSLNHIRRLPIDTIKIDGGFIRELGSHQEASAIVGAIVGMASALGLHVVAEGAETEEQALLASELGCGFGQGFHFAKPMPPGQLAAVKETIDDAAAARERSRRVKLTAGESRIGLRDGDAI